MFSQDDQPTRPGDANLGAVDQAAAEIAETAVERDLAAREDADAKRVLRARVLNGHVSHTLFVQKPAQFEIDQTGRQVFCVEGCAITVDLGDARRLGVRLGKPPRVVGDAALTYRCHTITSPSNGSYVSISRSITARIAISSDASATMSSPS